jgi:adenine phosphoribosyltransferase
MTAQHLSPQELKALVRTVPDFPHPGIQFRDITTLIGHHQGMAASVHHLAAAAGAAGIRASFITMTPAGASPS